MSLGQDVKSINYMADRSIIVEENTDSREAFFVYR